MRKLIPLALLLCLASTASAQARRSNQVILATNTAFGVILTPAVGAKINVCAYNPANYNATTGAYTGAVPCGSSATVYYDSGLTHPITQPFGTDANANYNYWVAVGNYTECVTGAPVANSCYAISVGATSTAITTCPQGGIGTLQFNLDGTNCNGVNGSQVDSFGSIILQPGSGATNPTLLLNSASSFIGPLTTLFTGGTWTFGVNGHITSSYTDGSTITISPVTTPQINLHDVPNNYQATLTTHGLDLSMVGGINPGGIKDSSGSYGNLGAILCSAGNSGGLPLGVSWSGTLCSGITLVNSRVFAIPDRTHSGGGALVTSDYNPLTGLVNFQTNLTADYVCVKVDAGASTIQLGYRNNGTTTAISPVLTPASVAGITDKIACASNGGGSVTIEGNTVTATSLTNTTLTKGDGLEIIGGVADGTSTRISIQLVAH